MVFHNAWDTIKSTFQEWGEDKATTQAAALSFYTIFSLAPLLVVAITVAGLFFGQEAARGTIMTRLQEWMGPEGAAAVQTMLQNTSAQKGAGILATVLGIVTLLLGAGALFAHLQRMLNTIWDVKINPNLSLGAKVKSRLTAYLMLLIVGALLLAMMVASAVLSALGSRIGDVLPGGAAVWQWLNFLLSLVVVWLLFALIFKVLPDVEIGWHEVWFGALVTAVLFAIGKYLIGLYLGHSAAGSAYGAAGSLVVLLLWIYYSAQIFFLGAEFTQVWARRHGADIRPAANAIPAT